MIPALKSSLHEQIFGVPGFCCDLRLTPAELALLRKWIRDRNLSHDEVRDKANRLFYSDQVAQIKTFAFFDAIRHELGPFTLSDVVVGHDIQRGVEEIYWRSVRPLEISDVGPMHRDTDHHERVPGLHGPNETTMKAWIAIETELGSNGLVVVPDSHLGYGRAETLLPLAPGGLVLFNERLLHRGAVNRGRKPRISAEITLVWGRQ